MKLRALVRDPESIERFLRHQNLWSPPQGLAPARAPPYHRSVTRLTPTRQQEFFADTWPALPDEGAPRPPGVACPDDAKRNLAHTYSVQIHPVAFPWPPVHRQFATAEPVRRPSQAPCPTAQIDYGLGGLLNYYYREAGTARDPIMAPDEITPDVAAQILRSRA
jgi:hypothetical protein